MLAFALAILTVSVKAVEKHLMARANLFFSPGSLVEWELRCRALSIQPKDFVWHCLGPSGPSCR